MQRVTVNMPDGLAEVLRLRAEHNHRSLSSEIVSLCEHRLADENEANLAILRVAQNMGLELPRSE